LIGHYWQDLPSSVLAEQLGSRRSRSESGFID
jgi:hypothetical protein